MIKVRTRELITLKNGERHDSENVQRCPACHLPISDQRLLSVDEETNRKLLEANNK